MIRLELLLIRVCFHCLLLSMALQSTVCKNLNGQSVKLLKRSFIGSVHIVLVWIGLFLCRFIHLLQSWLSTIQTTYFFLFAKTHSYFYRRACYHNYWIVFVTLGEKVLSSLVMLVLLFYFKKRACQNIKFFQWITELPVKNRSVDSRSRFISHNWCMTFNYTLVPKQNRIDIFESSIFFDFEWTHVTKLYTKQCSRTVTTR